MTKSDELKKARATYEAARKAKFDTFDKSEKARRAWQSAEAAEKEARIALHKATNAVLIEQGGAPLSLVEGHFGDDVLDFAMDEQPIEDKPNLAERAAKRRAKVLTIAEAKSKRA